MILFLYCQHYFVTLSKFKIMQNGNFKNPGQISLKDAASYTRNFRKEHKDPKTEKYFERSPCHFVSLDVLQKFMGIPNLQGINIYNGLTDNKEEVIILVGATKYEGKIYDVLRYTFGINGLPCKEEIVAFMYYLRPCPPPTPPATTCPTQISELNSDL